MQNRAGHPHAETPASGFWGGRDEVDVPRPRELARKQPNRRGGNDLIPPVNHMGFDDGLVVEEMLSDPPLVPRLFEGCRQQP